MKNEKMLYSKSPQIGVKELRALHDVQKFNQMLTHAELNAILCIYNIATERILRENGVPVNENK